MIIERLVRSSSNRRRVKRSNSMLSYSSGDDRDDRGWTNLHVGARKGDLKEVKRLLDEGMDANVAAFGPKSHGLTPLHLAAKGDHIKVMDELLERGANIDARTKGACGGWTPLHTAAKERNRRAIRFLIENGAFLPDNIEDTRFNPPVHYCPGLEWAYEEKKRVQQESGSSSGESSQSS
ncbi:hypothetical protein QVD17_01769 [Tagetes erecta]|uniref:Uncharacterized protein n=1 Tax=Tagetes erecta TaxID=13708 RepID=A0AAD8L5F3_TARER|nr:hypothetical protein QVD17_01769 [Tagetes erecta]